MPNTLAPYAGDWSFQKAAHLLRRTTYITDKQSIRDAESRGLEETVDILLAQIALPQPPLNSEYEDDPNTPIGETWVNNPYLSIQGFTGYRMQSLQSWTFEQFETKELNIREKLSLFWHNHFVIADVKDARYIYQYITAIRTHVLGNFRELTKIMTIDPSMLRYLNGNDNTKESPNENYARELLELFTVGKGDLAAPGDYTTFTEQDVRELARALTGWRNIGHNNSNANTFGALFVPNRHDAGDKVLSHRFNNAVITNGGDEEYKEVIDLIFTSDACAENISRELYRWFVFHEISEDVENNIILPMAQLIIENDYEIKPAIRALLLSEHFYADEGIGCMIKNPMDFVVSIMNMFDFQHPDNLRLDYALRRRVFTVISLMQMQIFEPPSVAGWKAYYQEPSYYRIWINTVSLPLRKAAIDALIEGVRIAGVHYRIEPLRFIQTIDQPEDVNSMLSELSELFYAKPLSENQIAAFKQILIPGLPDFEWSVEWSEYASDPDDPVKRETMDLKLQSLFGAMLNMPEYHLS